MKPLQAVGAHSSTGWMRVVERSVVVASSADPVTHGSGDPQDHTDGEQHEPDDPQDGHRENQSEYCKNQTKDDHLALPLLVRCAKRVPAVRIRKPRAD